jgi:hypothetical protein
LHRRVPGLIKVADSGFIHTRGFLDTGAEVIWVQDNRVNVFDSTLVPIDRGLLAGTDYVTMAKNNKTVPDVVAVTSNGCFNIFTGSSPTPFADLDLPANPTSVCDMDGYFVWSFANGTIYASDLNAVTVNALSFTTEQGSSIRRMIRFAGRLYSFGDKWCGVYTDVGTLPFPFQWQVQIPRGIVGTHAVAGWEVGWSNQLIWVGDDFVVYQLNGYTPTPISTPDVSRAIQTCVSEGKRDVIVASVYMYGNNAFWVLTCPGDWTWEYNLTTGSWNERQSYNQTCWKGIKTIRAYDKWLVGDQFTGQLYQTSETYFLEGTDPLVWQVESGVIHSFPRGIAISRASFNMTAGVGDFSIVPNPVVEISWSLDGGYRYGNPVLRNLGLPGATKSHPYVLQCGLSRGQGVRFRLRLADPCHVGLMGGMLEGAQKGFSG